MGNIEDWFKNPEFSDEDDNKEYENFMNTFGQPPKYPTKKEAFTTRRFPKPFSKAAKVDETSQTTSLSTESGAGPVKRRTKLHSAKVQTGEVLVMVEKLHELKRERNQAAQTGLPEVEGQVEAREEERPVEDSEILREKKDASAQTTEKYDEENMNKFVEWILNGKLDDLERCEGVLF